MKYLKSCPKSSSQINSFNKVCSNKLYWISRKYNKKSKRIWPMNRRFRKWKWFLFLFSLSLYFRYFNLKFRAARSFHWPGENVGPSIVVQINSIHWNPLSISMTTSVLDAKYSLSIKSDIVYKFRDS